MYADKLIMLFVALWQDSSTSQSMNLPQLNTLQSFSPTKIKDEDSDDKSTESLFDAVITLVLLILCC